ncbi:MAG: DUF433 domain-containing protein [Verrucomicrobia bacterium]|nr:DUF433 domain-containing protein [Verrucomicrobiota bacterium]
MDSNEATNGYHSDREILGGESVFAGTRVPVKTLLDYLEAGETIDDFLEGFPSVTREQVIQFIETAKAELLEPAS